MAVFFFDTSALLKRYVQESGSSWVREALAVPGRRIYVARIARLECISALSRRLLGSPPQPAVFAIARGQVEQDWRRRWQVVELSLNLIGDEPVQQIRIASGKRRVLLENRLFLMRFHVVVSRECRLLDRLMYRGIACGARRPA